MEAKKPVVEMMVVNFQANLQHACFVKSLLLNKLK